MNPAANELICTNTLRAWLQADIQRVPIPSEQEALRWADATWRTCDASATDSLQGALEPGRLFAILRIAGEDPSGDPQTLRRWYDATAQMRWASQEFNEKLDLLCHFAYLISRQYRRAGEPKLSRSWEQHTVELARQLPAVSDFLALRARDRTEQLLDRFLSDPCVLLSACDGLPRLMNQDPEEALRQAISAHGFILRSGALTTDREERSWFLVQLEILAAYGHKHCGNFTEAARWLDLANARCDSVSEPSVSRTRVEFLRRSIAYERHSYKDAHAGLAPLSEKFEEFGMHRNAVLCRYLNGIVLKELDLPTEALAELKVVAADEGVEVEDWIRGLALIFTAEIYVKEGEAQKGHEVLSSAWALIHESEMPSAVGQFHAVKGEILRDRGYLESAIQSYRQAVATYESCRFKALEAQVRVILAETLLACGRDDEAVVEIRTALSIIETLGLMKEGVVAVALLRESLGRQSANREALLTLRRVLQAHKVRNRP